MNDEFIFSVNTNGFGTTGKSVDLSVDVPLKRSAL